MSRPFDAAADVAAAAPVLGIPLTPEEERAVALQLERVHALAQLVCDAALDPEDELAGVFEP